MVRVILAFLRVGSRKAMTPLLTASTPVMAVQPEEKTLRMSQRLNAAVAGGTGGMGATGCGWPPAEQRRDDSHRDHDQQRARERVGGNHEHHAGIVDAAHVDDGQDQEHAQAQLERARLQRRHGGDECAHARRYADCRREYVIDHQGRGGQQPGVIAQVLGGHGVRPAAVRIGLDGLPVTEKDNR